MLIKILRLTIFDFFLTTIRTTYKKPCIKVFFVKNQNLLNLINYMNVIKLNNY